MAYGYWVLANRHGGAHIGIGGSAAEAKAEARQVIADTFATEGLAPSACKRAASSYRLSVIAGPVGYADARALSDTWEREDWATVRKHARPAVRARL